MRFCHLGAPRGLSVVFAAVVFPMEKEQKLQPKCPLTGEWTKQKSYSYIPVSTLSNLTNNAEFKKKTAENT